MFTDLKFYKTFVFIGLVTFLTLSCGGGGSDEDDPYIPPVIPPVDTTVITPTDLSLNITIVGVDADNPNGDGSGKIQFLLLHKCRFVALNPLCGRDFLHEFTDQGNRNWGGLLKSNTAFTHIGFFACFLGVFRFKPCQHCRIRI